MSDFGDYFLDELMELPLTTREWLVEGLIRERDSIILVGNEKSGKSLFIQQLISALTSCQPFLDKYVISRACKVVYIQLEGELSDTQDRFKRLNKTLDYHSKNCLLMYRAPLELQKKEVTVAIQNLIYTKLNREKPDIVIIDPVYFAFSGSLSDDSVVREFIGNIRTLKEALECSVILVHHTHKQKWTIDGTPLNEGDDAIFGSKFFKAWADHILMFIYNSKTGIRTLSCNTQRSGSIIRECNLKLIEPTPLYFEISQLESGAISCELSITELLKECNTPEGLCAIEIMKALGISKATFYKSIKKPLSEGLIIKSDKTHPILFCYNKDYKPNVKVEKNGQLVT